MAADSDTNARPRSSFLHQSRIPVPASKALKTCSALPISTSSRTPVSRLVSLKNEPRASLIEKLPNQKTSIIKPVVTKRVGPPFKEFNVVKAGTKSVIRKKNASGQREKPQKLFRQTTLPKNYFTSTSVETQESEVVVHGNREKENAPPEMHVNKAEEQVSVPDIQQKSVKNVVEIQKELDIKFEPSEFYRNQILNNKEVTLNQLVSSNPLEFDDKKYSDASAFALEKMKKLTISKPKLATASAKKNSLRPSFNGFCNPVQKMRDKQENFQFRCTWSPRISNLGSPSQPDPYEIAMASIRRLSTRKAHSPLDTKCKKNVASPQSSKNFSAYHEALRRIETLNGSRSFERNLVKKASKEVVCAVKSPIIVSSCVKSLDTNKAVYRPLETLKVTSAFKLQSQRLTDISEHSESDVTNSLSQNFSDMRKESDETCTDQPTSEVNEELLTSSKQCLRNSVISEFSSQKHSILSYFSTSPKVESYSSTKKQPSPSYLHTPRPVSFYSCRTNAEPAYLFNPHSTKSTTSHPAPICTPLVLQTIARLNEEKEILSPVKLKLDFNDTERECKLRNETEENGKWEGRFSLYTKHILTRGKIEDLYADEECSSIMALQPSTFSSSRLLRNPVARILSEGDKMHFVPISMDLDSCEVACC